MISKLKPDSPLAKARAYLREINLTRELTDFGIEEVGSYADEEARGWYYDGEASRPFHQLDAIILSQSLHHFISIEEKKITKDQKLTPGTSKTKGLPDLPASMTWPTGMLFVAQFNLADLVQHDIEQVLPAKGMLYFFFSPSSAECRVLYYDGPLNELAARPYPAEDFPDRKHYTEKFEKSGYTVRFQKEATISIDDLVPLLPAEVKDRVERLVGCNLVDHQGSETLFGQPRFWQGENEAFDGEQREGDADLLLFQYEFGEGTIHFWIAGEELAAGDFSKVWLTYSGT